MLTNDDIVKLSAVLVTKEDLKDFYNKAELDQKFGSLQTSVDGLANTFKKYYDEQQIYVHKLNRMEDWIKKASTKLGIDFNL